MDKKAKDNLRRYKKTRRAQSSSDSSSSSDSDSGSSSSYSSSDSERRRRHKKARPPTGRSSSSDEERRKREKREHCQKKLEAKRNHIKRKLKEAKLRKKAAAAAAALSGHSHRPLSPSTQAKLKKLAERKHLRAASKEKREREKHRAAAREREREHHRGNSRSSSKVNKARVHQDVKRQKSPPRVHQQLMSREKIIIQTRNRERSASVDRERQRYEHKMRHEEMLRDREREANRDKERAEALARCQERQRERERLAREKLRREEAVSGERERMLSRPPGREMSIKNRAFTSRDRSVEHSRRGESDPYDHAYTRKHREETDYIRDNAERERHLHGEREEMLREREYMVSRRRELSPGEYGNVNAGMNRMREDMRGDMYMQDDRDRAYKRPFVDENLGHMMHHDRWLNEQDMRERGIRGQHEYRDMEPNPHFYRDERDPENLIRGREDRPFLHRPVEWKHDWNIAQEHGEWNESGIAPAAVHGIGFTGGPKRGGIAASGAKIPVNREQRQPSEPDWEIEEGQIETNNTKTEINRRETPLPRDWTDHNPREIPPQIRQEKLNAPPIIGGKPQRPPWAPEWHEPEVAGILNYPRPPQMHRPFSERGGRGGFRRGGGIMEHGERFPNLHMHGFRPRGPGPLVNMPIGPPYHGGPHIQRFPFKRSLTYTNPNLLKKQQAALAAATTAVAAAKAAAQSTATATTNPGILSQLVQPNNETNANKQEEKTEINESDKQDDQQQDDNTSTISKNTANSEKPTGELSEISDSDDDILNKNEKKAKIDTEDTSSQEHLINDNEKDTKSPDEKVPDEDLLDFEEISDGELEEEAKTKGVADALGVDWASLVAESKRLPKRTSSTGKQRWQPHRIILELGVSMHLAGEEYAKQILKEAQTKLSGESTNGILAEKETTIKDEQYNDAESNEVESKQTMIKDIKLEPKLVESNDDFMTNIDNLHPVACAQVGERRRQMERKNLIANACGMNSRALSARQDLQLRRQLCGLPGAECEFGHNIPSPSNEVKAMALAAFQRTLEVK